MARLRKALTAGALGAASVALIAAATGTTGAYFSDAQGGTITGAVGSVHLATSNTTFSWTNMMPGEPKSASVDFQNTGTGNQDFYIVFNNVPALHALNNLGSYGEVHVVDGNGNHLFDSANLQDGRHQVSGGTNGVNTCGTFSDTGCWPLPTELKIASNVAPTAWNSVSFSFNYAGKLGDANPTKGVPASSGGGTFNQYPLAGNDIFAGSAGTADGAAPAGAGLPFQVVAVQVGQKP
jgi:hypothetical protein